MYQSVAATATGRRCTRVAPLARSSSPSSTTLDALPCCPAALLCPVVVLPGRMQGVIRRRAGGHAHCIARERRHAKPATMPPSAVAVHGDVPTEWMRSRVLASHPWTSRPLFLKHPRRSTGTHTARHPGTSHRHAHRHRHRQFGPSPVSMTVTHTARPSPPLARRHVTSHPRKPQ